MSKWSQASERYYAEEALWKDDLPTVARCLFCGWSAEGSAGQVRLAGLEHRLSAHPETKTYKRKRPVRQLKSFRPVLLYEEEKKEIEADRIRRAFQHGIEP